MKSAGGLPARAFMSIGEVLALLRTDFPDMTISKIRFLEAEGLLEPERAPSGYRKFSREDVTRLRYVLSAQRDQYLPLRVIKDQLAALDRGEQTPGPAEGGSPPPRPMIAAEALPGPEAFSRQRSDVRLTRAQLLAATGLTETQLGAIEAYGLLSARAGGGHYDGDAVAIAKAVAEMSRFGIEARHLRPFKAAADREVGLVEQVVTPLMRQRSPDARARAGEAARELAALSVQLHAALIRAGLSPGLLG